MTDDTFSKSIPAVAPSWHCTFGAMIPCYDIKLYNDAIVLVVFNPGLEFAVLRAGSSISRFSSLSTYADNAEEMSVTG